jgi:hypothetical protein
MPYTFFYVSIIAIIILFFVISYFKPVGLNNIMIGITTIGYTMVYDIIFGDRFKLYYYISPSVSTFYIVLASVFLYPLLNMIYTLYLPGKIKNILIYTGAWIVLMILFEYISLLAHAIVFTGWKPVPWSFITYIVTYIWIVLLFGYLKAKVVE